jgi:hypothetical protein
VLLRVVEGGDGGWRLVEEDEDLVMVGFGIYQWYR